MNDVKVLMTHPAHMFICDGLWIGGVPNPRTYGTFATPRHFPSGIEYVFVNGEMGSKKEGTQALCPESQ
jgi:hypothetical protein